MIYILNCQFQGKLTKGYSKEDVATALKMDQSQYSKIENGKVDPQFSTIEKIANALEVKIVDLVAADDIFKDVSTYDTLVEKIQQVKQLEDNEKNPSSLLSMDSSPN